MKYIIMCGGNYPAWKTPRQLLPINGEPVVARTIRLLEEAGVEDIAISSNNMMFEGFGVPVLQHVNGFVGYSNVGSWQECFYPMDTPACYLLGDVVFSPAAIRTIVDTETNDIEFFASAPPFAKDYIKQHAEPFAFKVTDQEHLQRARVTVMALDGAKFFKRRPIAWELWQVIKGTPLNEIDFSNYTVINDYTCDIDTPEDAEKIGGVVNDS